MAVSVTPGCVLHPGLPPPVVARSIVVVLATKLHIFDLESLRALATVDCADNPRGLCVLSPNDKSSLLVFPSSSLSGELLVYSALSLSVVNVIRAHVSATTALAISLCGTRLATASETVRCHDDDFHHHYHCYPHTHTPHHQHHYATRRQPLLHINAITVALRFATHVHCRACWMECI